MSHISRAAPGRPGAGAAQRLAAASRGALRALEGFLAALLAASTVLIGYTVFARYVLKKPPSWTEESALFLMVWLGLLSGAVGVARRSHVAIEFVLSSLPADARKALRTLIDLAISAFGGFVVIRGIELVRLAWLQRASSVPLRMGQVYIALPLSGAIIAVVSLRNAVTGWRGSR